MCGIIGASVKDNAVQKLIEGLSALEYRGYDSAGIAVFSENGEIVTHKAKGRLANLEEKLPTDLTSGCGIGHTRWATHGEPSDANSHPHGTENVAVVHNGIIENYSELKDFLIKNGYTFLSETDTEVAALMIDYFYKESKNPEKAIQMASDKFTGSYAIGIIFKDYPGVIYAIRKDNPLICAVTDNGCYIASDISAILKYTDRYAILKEGEILKISVDNAELISKNELKWETVAWSFEDAKKSGYPHYMIKEIHEQPNSIRNTVSAYSSDLLPDIKISELTDEKLKSFNKIHIIACGTAMHAGLVGKAVIEAICRVPVNVEIASEFRYKNPILKKDDLAIIISQSGETADTLASLRLCKERGVYTMGIVNVHGSTIAREADGVMYTNAGPEIAVASTKAYSVQLCALYVFALRLAYVLGKMSEDSVKSMFAELLYELPTAVMKSVEMKEKCEEIAKKYKMSKSIFFIGRGVDYALSMEASLKLKEVSYIHCESYAAGEMKHGTISLISDGSPVFAIATSKDTLKKMISNIKEVKARGAKIVLLCPKSFDIPEEIADDILYVSEVSDIYMPLTTVPLSQLVAYYTAVQLGYDVDKPRNLAKSVTVE